MELETTTTIREKINWIEDQPIAWDKHQAWMRIERGGEKEEPARRFAYYAAAVVVIGIVSIVGGDYKRDVVKGGIGISEGVGANGDAEGISNIEHRISNVEVGAAEVACGNVRATQLERNITTAQIIAPEATETAVPFVLMPEPVDGQRIAIVENAKPVVAQVEKVRAIFGVEEPTVALIRQGKKLRIYFLQNEVSQSSVVNVDEPAGLEARINKK